MSYPHVLARDADLYYFAPPPAEGDGDSRLRRLLAALSAARPAALSISVPVACMEIAPVPGSTRPMRSIQAHLARADVPMPKPRCVIGALQLVCRW